jgi:hypothetical protein
MKWHDHLADGLLPFLFLLIVIPLAPVAWIIYLLVWAFTRDATFAGFAYLICIVYLFVRSYRARLLLAPASSGLNISSGLTDDADCVALGRG